MGLIELFVRLFLRKRYEKAQKCKRKKEKAFAQMITEKSGEGRRLFCKPFLDRNSKRDNKKAEKMQRIGKIISGKCKKQ